MTLYAITLTFVLGLFIGAIVTIFMSLRQERLTGHTMAIVHRSVSKPFVIPQKTTTFDHE